MQLEEEQMTEEEMFNEMLMKAEEAGVDTTDNTRRIARARINLKLPITVCPCDPKSDRGCISDRCAREIKENGICHCRCFKRRD